MRKYKLISALAEETAKEVVRNEENWRRYLNTASRLYKYPFKEQLLIYAQRPEATACASIEIWNEKMHCWVNKGAKGIALIDEDSFSGLKYVFDISDVHKARRIGQFPNLWEMREEHMESVISRLEKTYGDTDREAGFVGRIREIAGRIAEDCYKELASDMEYLKEGSFLEELDELNVEIRIRETLADSIAYTVLKRCGMEESELAEEINFPYIHEFNTVETLSQLGSNVSDLSKPILMEIGKAIGAYDRQIAQNREETRVGRERIDTHEKNIEKGLANASEEDYNALKRESESQDEQSITQTGEAGERSKYDESDIREERGLSDTDGSNGRTAEGGTDKVRTDEEEVLTGAQERSIYGTSSEREAEGTLVDDTGAGRGENGASDQTDEGERGDNGADESRESDALGSEDEQHRTLGRGDRDDGTNLQLNIEQPEGTYQQLSLFPSFEEQVGTIAAAEASIQYTMPAAFSLPQEQIDSILRSGGGRDNSRKRIYAKYQQGKTPEEMAEFLKNEYKTTGKGFEFDGNPVSLWFDEMGMRIGYGTSAKENTLAVMSWSEVESHIRVMVENGTYMSANEVFLVDAVERERIATDINNFFRDGISEMPESLELKFSNYPASMEKLCELLATTEGRELIKDELEKAKAQLDSGEKQIKWRYVKRPDYLLEQLADLGVEKKEFPALDTVEVRNEDFITQDEIDYRLAGGSGFEHGKFRIYEYFMEGHDKKDNIAFLKNEYGTGGSSHALPGSDRAHEDHDAKGIRLEKGNYGSPYAKVLLNWNVVEKRIRELVQADKYLSPEGKEAYAQYKQEQAEKAMQKEQAKLEGGVTNQELDRETGTVAEGEPKAPETGKTDIEQLNKRLSEMSAVVKICGALDRKDVVGWNEKTQAVTIADDERALEGKEVYDFLFAEAADYVMMQTISGETEKALEMDGLLKDAGQYAAHYEGEPAIEQTEEPPLTADDVQNLVLIDREYIRGTRTTVYDFECDIRGEHDKLQYTLGYHDDGEGFTIHTEKDDIWERMPEPELARLEGILVREALYFKYHDKIAGAKSLEDMEEIRFSIMEEESPYFSAVSQRIWGEYEQKNEELSNPMQESEVIAEPEPQNEAEAPKEQPQIDKSGAVNFHIAPETEKSDGKGFAAKEKFRQNVEAIRTLEKIEGENRIATPEEQEILAKYVGWGGLADAFDETKTNWASEYQELKSLLSAEEYDSARESTLNAHYTSPVIIKAIYDAMERMGFSKGNILEPAMGIGNFFGMLPEKMQESRLYGVELDGITGRIARQLYPNADVKITGFEKTDYPNDFFDVAIGNVPFGQYKVADRAYDKHNFLIHDYFFAKALDKVRPGGVVAFVTSKGTMDKKSPEVRKYLAQRAELLGAIRLPNTAFKENAGTEVTSDILFLKKRDRVIDIEPDWVHLCENEDGIAMNQYFADHPEMIMGKMEMVSGQFGMEATCTPDTTISLSKQLEKAISHIEGSIDEVEFDELDDELAREAIPADPGVKNYSYTIVDERVYYRENSIMKPVDVSETMEQRMKGMVQIRDCTQELIDYQLNEYPEDMIKSKQAELNELYDAFSKKYGLINSQTNKRAFNQDSSYCLLCSLEKLDDEGNFKGKADMFSKRTIKKAERYTIKQMEKTKKSLDARLSRLNDTSRKDNVVTFEQLGVDRLFVDESHNYKNLFLYTKMRNVAGIAQTEAQKSSDMFAKCQYMDELTGGKGITFATGTPISNSMTELYTNMRYLQYSTLQKLGLGNFDSWAATFGETQTAIELAPEGTGYRAKTRFAKFFNLPELISLFKESADIQTPDMLKLPVPEAEYENVVLKPSEYQKEMVQSLADRAEAVRDRKVEPHVDNMLKITNDGRKLALDQRLINDMLPDEDNSKSTTCVDKAFEIWEETKEQKSAQLIFCDLSTPKGDGTFNVYEDICNKLKEKGVPPEEIAFIHDANTEKRKAELFAKVRSGQVRFLLGSTAKMGAGTNVQDRLIALHHLDVPWRPSDIEQQEGRILRQGNMNDKVKIFRYVTEGTFDSYSWQLIENKQKFIGQIMTSKSPVRSCEDIDEAALSYAEVKALATGNPYIKEKMDLDIQVSKLKLLKANHTSQRYRLENNIAKHYPMQITALKERLEGYRADIQTYAAHKPVDKDAFSMKIGNRTYTDKKEAGAALIDMCRSAKQPNMAVTIGEYQGFKMSVSFDSFFSKFTISLKGSLSHEVEIGADPLGNLQRLSNALEGMTGKMADVEQKLSNVEHQLETAKVEVTKPFAQEQELAEKLERLAELNTLLNMDEKGDNALDMGDDEPEDENGEQSAQTQESEPNRAEDIQAVAEEPLKPVASFLMSERIAEHDKERMLADGSGGRVSVKEKLAEMKQKIFDQKMPEKPETVKSKGKEESL